MLSLLPQFDKEGEELLDNIYTSFNQIESLKSISKGTIRRALLEVHNPKSDTRDLDSFLTCVWVSNSLADVLNMKTNPNVNKELEVNEAQFKSRIQNLLEQNLNK